MKKLILTLLAASIAGLASHAQVTIYSTDFSSDTLIFDDNTDGGLLYKSQFTGEGTWGALASGAVDITTTKGSAALTLKGHENGSNRSAAMFINSATINGLTGLNTFELNFDILDINNAAGSTLYVSVFEAKFGVGSPNAYYMDVVTAAGVNGSVGKFAASDASFNQLGTTVTYTDADTAGGTSGLLDQTISFTRSDSSFDLVVFFGFDRDVTFSNAAWVDDVSITAVPEPSMYALLGGFLTLGFVLIRRRLK
ncbi:PEP-CTERM sorting domain-containing protein [Puniceicoccales bacterium CK1056]|uniref:PEP-CTERM sorting domain-containing protein n=1 Tax=Oceanipulchritudo coccoides TaxID=2706888 RepID=A0A6B2LZY1_9BACT|nr:PEP-CTERM sorting domain-containing protein [Oceanipulchritudo coccoides]NDV61636.1 PEP-CTERM sorting domain-containing protein [Oceanipulchritudo coccoides]